MTSDPTPKPNTEALRLLFHELRLRIPSDNLGAYQTLGDLENRVAADIRALDAERVRLREALVRIEKWFGEFPPTGRTWNDDGSGGEMSYAACYGSNGERDYMRQIARDALHPPANERAQTDQ